MEQVELTVDKRTESGKRISHALRQQGLIPANLHGLNKNDAMSLSINARHFMLATHNETSGNMIFKLAVSGTKNKAEIAIIKEMQLDPVKGFILHIDFQKISLKEKITVPVPVHLIGQSIGVKDGGVVDHQLHKIEISALPTDILKHIEIDITELKIGDSVHVENLDLGENIEIITKADETIVMISHQVVVAEPSEGEEEAVEVEESTEPEVMSRGKETTGEES